LYERILVPLDGSELAEGVLPYVEELAKRLGSEVVLLQAVTSLAQLMSQAAASDPTAMSAVSVEVARQEHEALVAAARDYLTRIADRLVHQGIATQVEAVDGSAGGAILDYLRAQEVSLIAMSTHGRGGLGRLVFGSVADAVLRQTHLPVLLVRPVQA